MLFGLLSGVRRKPKPVSRKPVRLRLEALETRYCPSPTITNFTAVPTNNGTRQIELKGTVSDGNQTYVTIQFGGVASGMTMVQGSSNFDFFTTASGLGQVSAVASDFQGSSAPVTATITVPPPVITSFAVIAGPGGTWTFEGHVNDPAPQGVFVTFTGPGSVNGKMTNLDANGNFDVTYLLGNIQGGISAVATDIWGQLSNTVYDPLA